ADPLRDRLTIRLVRYLTDQAVGRDRGGIERFVTGTDHRNPHPSDTAVRIALHDCRSASNGKIAVAPAVFAEARSRPTRPSRNLDRNQHFVWRNRCAQRTLEKLTS